jgi:phosphodiesterase/alkaline phosphatase D-like protein
MKAQLTIALAAAFCFSGTAFARQPQTHAKAPAEKIINGPVIEAVGQDSAVIAWTTNTGGSSIVRYGTDKNSLSLIAEAPYSDNEKTQSQNHRVHIKGLNPGTTYYFIVDSGQGEGSGTEAKSDVKSFTTKGSSSVARTKPAALQIINGPRVEATERDSAVIAWTTNTGGSSIVRYGTDKSSLSLTAESPYSDNEAMQNQTHRVKLTKLQPNTTYYFIVDSGQGEGSGTEAKSGVSTFKTKAK